MVLLPVATREVREASRQSRTYRWRWVTAAAALALMTFVTWVTRYSFSQGHDVFVAVSTAAYIYCLLAGAVRTADTIAEEKRENTLGLLFLTDLKGWDIVFGKLLSSSVNCLFGLLAMFPMLAIPALMGGVPWDEFARVVLNLLNTLFLSISLGFLISSLLKHSVATVSAGLIAMIFAGGALPLICSILHDEYHWKALTEFVMYFSPSQPHVNAFSSHPSYFAHYWGPLILQHAIAWFNLRAAIFFLPRFWQDTPRNKKSERWRERIRAWRFGKTRAKTRLRERLLNQNPLYWLSNREQVSSMGVMILASIILTGALFIGIGMTHGRARVDEMAVSWLIGVVLVHVVVAFRLATAAAWRLSEDRRSGALELLLGTEVSIQEVLRGHWMALRRQFFGPALIVTLAAIFGLSLLLQMFSADMGLMGLWETLLEIFLRLGRRGADWEMGIIFIMFSSIQAMLMLNWIAIGSVGMWMGLRERRSGFAPWITLAIVLLPPWIVLIMGIASLEEAGALRSVRPEVMIPCVMVAGWILGLSHMLFLWFWSRRNLLARFREVAADRYAGPMPFPWRKIGVVGIRLAGGVAALWLLLAGLRGFVDYRGEKAWNKALATHPDFAAAYRQPLKRGSEFPASENLAKVQFFTTLLQPGGSRKQITWNMSQFVGPGRNDSLRWDWGERHTLNLTNIRAMYVQRKVLKTNETGSAAEQVLGAMEKVYAKDFADLRKEAAARPRARFEVEFTNPRPSRGPAMAWSYLFLNNDPRPTLRELIDTIAVMSSARLAVGEDPIDDIFLGLRIARGLENDPRSFLQYHEMLLDMTQPIYDGLVTRRWKNDELKRIQDFYAGLDLWSRYEEFRKDWLVRVVGFQEGWIEGRRYVTGKRKPSWFERQMPIGFVRKSQADVVEWGMTEIPKAVNLTERRIDLSKAKTIEDLNPQPQNFLGVTESLSQSLRSLAFTQTTVDQIIVACAVERFRNDRGALPRKLEELVPNYLAAVPNDVLIEKPLSYRVKEDGQHYIIYSVGADGLDEGGKAIPHAGTWLLWQEKHGDWVWDSEPIDPAPRLIKRMGPKGKVYYTQ